MSLEPLAKLPYRFVKSAVNKFFKRSLASSVKYDGYRILPAMIFSYKRIGFVSLHTSISFRKTRKGVQPTFSKEGRIASQHFEHEDAQSVPVYAFIISARLHNFGR